jgi:hypothetical protein
MHDRKNTIPASPRRNYRRLRGGGRMKLIRKLGFIQPPRY